MVRGVVIGKFYPLHKGHQYLIETAISLTDQLSVIVCQEKKEKIPGKLRVEWIKELYPKAKVILINCDGFNQNDSKFWAEMTIKWLGFKPDMVFTSENYGESYGKFMGSKHILVDKNREKFPISGTKIRENPYKYWQYLEPVVRQYFVKRICIIGAESTGTTTLSLDLAKYYNTVWVPEYGRLYSEGKVFSPSVKNWDSKEFVHIASMQNILEDELTKYAEKLLICDTNSWATAVWHERYIGKWSKEVEKLSKGRKYDLYLITDIDIPFIQDGTRDGVHVRKWMHNRFIELLKKKKEKFKVLSGSRKNRLNKAISLLTPI